MIHHSLVLKLAVSTLEVCSRRIYNMDVDMIVLHTLSAASVSGVHDG